MHPTARGLLDKNREAICEACERFGVARLELFGSAMTGAFDPASSDLDFLVSFNDDARRRAFDSYFGLKERLEAITGCPVDLVTDASVKNPYLRAAISRDRYPLYVADLVEAAG